MKTADIIEFFDKLAPVWDSEQVDREKIIEKILDNAKLGAGQRVLDVACGTGVMFPHYLRRGVSSVTGIDISSEMAKIAAEKFADNAEICLVCGDVETAELEGGFDSVVVYNAFPHFPEPARLIKRLSELLNDGGRLTVAHGMSREKINEHHKGAASAVSMGLPHAEELAVMFAPYFTVDVMISNEEMFEVSGVKN